VCVSLPPSMFNGGYDGIGKIKLER
jgi:hypothetical protein